MASRLLPRLISVRKSFQKSAVYSGGLPEESWQVLVPAVERLDDISAEILFRVPENDHRGEVVVEARAVATMVCQRCLGDVSVELVAKSTLSVVRHDEEARSRLQDIDPLIVEQDEYDLHALVIEELSLQLPVVARHPQSEIELCDEQLKERLEHAESKDYLNVMSTVDGSSTSAASGREGQASSDAASRLDTTRPFADLGQMLSEQAAATDPAIEENQENKGNG